MSLTEIYTLSLHDALPIFNAITHANASDPEKRVFIDYSVSYEPDPPDFIVTVRDQGPGFDPDTLKNPLTPENMLNTRDRKSTRLNSSHSQISYAVFCLKKK